MSEDCAFMPCYRVNILQICHHVTPSPIIYRLLSSSSRKVTCNYEVLGLTPNATTKEIKEAYYEKSKQFHPDVNPSPDAAKKFQQVTSAYGVLSNERDRSDYDYSRGYKGSSKAHQYQQPPQQYYKTEEPDFTMDFSELKVKRRFNLKLKKATGNKDFQEFMGKSYKSSNEGQESHQSEFNYSQKFYDNMSDDMKQSYKEFLHKREQGLKQGMAEGQEGSGSTVLVIFLISGVMLGLFELCATYFKIFDEKPEKK